MELDHAFIVIPKNAFHETHFIPRRAASVQRHAHMLPAFSIAHNAAENLVHVAHHENAIESERLIGAHARVDPQTLAAVRR